MSWLFPRLAADSACAAVAPPRWGTVAAVVAAHAAILLAASTIVPAGQLADLVQPLTVRLVEWQQEAPPQPAAEPPRPMPVKPQHPVVLASAAPLTAGQPVVSEVVAIQAAVLPAPTFVAPPLVEARFDAAYLNNPKPAYPAASRRLGEEGRVVLRVQVNAEGQADAVDIKVSSGFPRLDAAAREAVARWRFVPARRGEIPFPSAVLVPVVFNLES
jgi:periplasmic protein TonB